MQPTYAEHVRLRIAFAVALIVQVVALYVPRAPGVASGLPLDKVAHLAMFAAVTTLGLLLGYRWIVPVMVVQAGLSELVQMWFLSQRGGDIWDFVADLAGIGLGVVITLTYAKTKDVSGIPIPLKGTRKGR
jgi:VanZ family protein